ncbi:crossover junction endodeoxyribonuclease RuvC [bacterium]|nr:crossover junction endodeoxyribonuclease RuvC [bacterium]
MEKGVRILGIDPGSRLMGFGLIEWDGKTPVFIEAGTIKFNTETDALTRLGEIQQSVSHLIERLAPDQLAAEAPFQGKSVQSMLKLGRVQGVVIATAMARGIACSEYPPARVKQSLTGRGRAGKEQVATLVRHLLFPGMRFEALPEWGSDATDALAVALCHGFGLGKKPQTQAESDAPRASASGKTALRRAASWSDFLKENPSRLRKS